MRSLILFFLVLNLQAAYAACAGLDFPLSSSNSNDVFQSAKGDISVKAKNSILIDGTATKNAFFEAVVPAPERFINRNVLVRKFSITGSKAIDVNITIKTLTSQYDPNSFFSTRTFAFSKLDDAGNVDCKQGIDGDFVRAGTSTFNNVNLKNPFQVSLDDKGANTTLKFKNLTLQPNTTYQFEFIAQGEKSASATLNERYQVLFGSEAVNNIDEGFVGDDVQGGDEEEEETVEEPVETPIDNGTEMIDDADTDDEGVGNGDEMLEPEGPEPVDEIEEEPEDCGGRFITNGVQPVQKSFQDDNHFFAHTNVDNLTLEDDAVAFGETLNIFAGLKQIKDKVTEIYANTGTKYRDRIQSFVPVTFTYATRYSEEGPVDFVVTAEDGSGELTRYEKKGLKAFYLGKCLDKEVVRTLTVKLPVIAKNPQPSPFEFKQLGAGNAKATLVQSTDSSILMQGQTNFEVVQTQLGKIVIIPLVDRLDPLGLFFQDDQQLIARRALQDAIELSTTLEKRLPDIFPLKSKGSVTTSVAGSLAVALPTSLFVNDFVRTVVYKNLLSAALRFANSRSSADVQGDIILAMITDRDTFKAFQPGAEAFTTNNIAELGSETNGIIVIPGRGTFKRKGKLRLQNRLGWARGKLNVVAHELAHKHGFHGEARSLLSTNTTCPPDIHNIVGNEAKNSDGVDVTFEGNFNANARRSHFNKKFIMSEGRPVARISQCTYTNLINIFKVASSSNRVKQLQAAGSQSSFTQIFINPDNGSASFLAAYDSDDAVSDFLDNGDDAWAFDFRDSSGNSLEKRFFDPSGFSSRHRNDVGEELVLDYNLPLLSGVGTVAILNDEGETVDEIECSDTVPVVSNLQVSSSLENNVETFTLTWEASDASASSLSSTVLFFDDEGRAYAPDDAFMLQGNSYSFNALSVIEGIESVQVVVTNGSRSSESEILDLEISSPVE